MTKKLEEGEQAPGFTGTDQNNNQIDLSDFKGRKLILYFYPRDMTPGCTNEACNLRDNYDELTDHGFAIVGISPDSIKSHQKFAEKYGLFFSLIADENKEILQAYGVWGEKKMAGRSYMGVNRTTFIIDETGKLLKIFKKVQTKDHTAQILSALVN